jgi:hypothetical protein
MSLLMFGVISWPATLAPIATRSSPSTWMTMTFLPL